MNLAPLGTKGEDGKKLKTERPKRSGKPSQRTSKAGTPRNIAAEVEKALQSALVHLSPSTNTSVKVGYSSWAAQKLAENVEAVANGLVEKFVPKKWRGVKSLHVKGPETVALPIWLADEMWVDESDVLEDEVVVAANTGKKRKKRDDEGKAAEDGKERKKLKLMESNDENLDKAIKSRKEMLKKQKAAAAAVGNDDVPKATRKPKKSKAKAEVSGAGA